MKEFIDGLMNQFLREAEASPLLCADMAQMEKYIAESYNNRAFIELIQNADDACSKKVYISFRNGNLYLANDGKLFTKEDVSSICRSGASTKKRGENIGYRGVGFKSSTCFSNCILINSGDCLFAFSNDHIAEMLNTRKELVPTVRVPYNVSIEELDKELQTDIQDIKNLGYQTIFVFRNAKKDTCMNEIQSIDMDSIIFLYSIQEVFIDKTLKYTRLNRSLFSLEGYTVIQIIDEAIGKKKEWIAIGNHNSYKVAIPQSTEDDYYMIDNNVFHCFLPTLDRTGFGFRINGDFSTDPSRKHIVYDNITDNELKQSAMFLSKTIKWAIGKHDEFSKMFIKGVADYKTTNQFSAKLFSLLYEMVQNEQIITSYSGETIRLTDAVLLPQWADATLIQPLSSIQKNKKPFIELDSIYRKMFILFDCNQPSMEEMIGILKDKTLVQQLSAETSLSLLLCCSEYVKNKGNCSIGSLYVKTFDGKITELQQAILNSLYGDSLFGKADGFIDRATIQWLKKELKISSGEESPITAMLNKRKKVIARWQTAEQLCVEIEKEKGNTVKNVSEQNVGYDVLSVSPSGKIAYIEVKSIKTPGEPFIMTNNEYTTAHQYGEDYFLCLVTQTNPPTVLYIKNPLNSKAHIEKRVRMWEWVYSDYSGNFEVHT